jgi:hypothetical protein
MKIKHNKKRNTAFVYEALIRENTVAILRQDSVKQDKINLILKKHFSAGTVLRKDLECYRSLYEKRNLDALTNEKILQESKFQKSQIPDDILFDAQSSLIKDVNKNLSPSLFNNFVPNYKTLATIAQVFSVATKPADRVLLENQILVTMNKVTEADSNKPDIDNVVYRSFVKKFNEKYDTDLLEEQKVLLSHYISSFADNALALKTFLNEEIGRLKDALSQAQENEHIKEDKDMLTKSRQIIERLDACSQEGISDHLLTTVLKTQKLVKELQSDGDSN